MSSNLVFTIWAVFGGFILHFLLSNYLTVLLRPSYEEPVETTADMIKRNIIPFTIPNASIWKQFFEASPDQNYQLISQRLFITKTWDEYTDMVGTVTSTGKYADMGPWPWLAPEKEFKEWYRSTETFSGLLPFGQHLSNKKWPLKKVL